MVNLIWNFQVPPGKQKILSNLHRNKDGLVTISEFVLFHKHYPQILEPLHKAQKRLRKKIVFSRFWRELTARRLANFGFQPIFTILYRDDPDWVIFGLEYAAARTDVPRNYVEQWRFYQGRKKYARNVNIDIPVELITWNPPVIKKKYDPEKKKRKAAKKLAALEAREQESKDGSSQISVSQVGGGSKAGSKVGSEMVGESKTILLSIFFNQN